MQCFVYRSSKKEGLYVYLREKDRLDLLPPPLKAEMGVAELALTFELDTNKKLGSEDPLKVISNLEKQGFHVQMPRDVESLIETLAHKR